MYNVITNIIIVSNSAYSRGFIYTPLFIYPQRALGNRGWGPGSQGTYPLLDPYKQYKPLFNKI